MHSECEARSAAGARSVRATNVQKDAYGEQSCSDDGGNASIDITVEKMHSYT
jgi:hypothetical protein